MHFKLDDIHYPRRGWQQPPRRLGGLRLSWKPSKQGPETSKRYGINNIANRLFFCLVNNPDGLTRRDIRLLTGLDDTQIQNALANLRYQGHIINYCYASKTFKM